MTDIAEREESLKLCPLPDLLSGARSHLNDLWNPSFDDPAMRENAHQWLVAYIRKIDYHDFAAGAAMRVEAGVHLFRPADRVECSPACDCWMRGDRFGEVVSVGRRLVHVKMDRSGQTRRFDPSLLTVVS